MVVVETSRYQNEKTDTQQMQTQHELAALVHGLKPSSGTKGSVSVAAGSPADACSTLTRAEIFDSEAGTKSQ